MTDQLSARLSGVIDPSLFKRGMRRLAAGVSVVTTAEHGTPHGFVATSVSSVCAEPVPSLLVCINRSVSSHDVIRRTGVFCANLLSSQDVELARSFASSRDRAKRFEAREWVALVTGAPALPGALASFDCEITDVMSVHSHSIVVGAVRDIRLWRDEVAPLLYFDGQYEVLPLNAGRSPVR
jgi:flavin reductase